MAVAAMSRGQPLDPRPEDVAFDLLRDDDFFNVDVDPEMRAVYQAAFAEEMSNLDSDDEDEVQAQPEVNVLEERDTAQLPAVPRQSEAAVRSTRFVARPAASPSKWSEQLSPIKELDPFEMDDKTWANPASKQPAQIDDVWHEGRGDPWSQAWEARPRQRSSSPSPTLGAPSNDVFEVQPPSAPTAQQTLEPVSKLVRREPLLPLLLKAETRTPSHASQASSGSRGSKKSRFCGGVQRGHDWPQGLLRGMRGAGLWRLPAPHR